MLFSWDLSQMPEKHLFLFALGLLTVLGFDRKDLRAMNSVDQLKMVHDGTSACEYCVSPDELNEVVGYLNWRDAERVKIGQPASRFEFPSEGKF
jgi:hypothetical protein